MEKKSIKLLILVVISFLLYVNISFANLYVKPAKQGIVDVKIFSFVPATVEKDFEVGNFYDFPIDIRLEPAGDISRVIDISETSFTLQSNETKNISYTLTIKEAGVYSGGIAINVKSEKGMPTISYQSDLTVVANKSRIPPEIYIIITLIIVIFLTVLYLKNRRGSKK